MCIAKRACVPKTLTTLPGLGVAATDQNEGGNNPIELAFQERYGSIVAHRWFGDGYIMIGFSSGYVLVISTHNKELSEEVHSEKYLRNTLTSVAYCESLDRAAVCGGNSVKASSPAPGLVKCVFLCEGVVGSHAAGRRVGRSWID